MNECTFSSDRIYRYVLRCWCAPVVAESVSTGPRAAWDSDRAQHSKTPALHYPTQLVSRTRTKLRIAWIGLNPSTADEVTLDQTLSTVCRYSSKWGFSEVVMLNLFAFRATDPRDLKRATDPVGPDNDEHLLAEIGNVDRVIACWGDQGKFLGRDRRVADLLKVSFECLLRNRTGAPHHPLYLKSRIRPKPFRLDQIRN